MPRILESRAANGAIARRLDQARESSGASPDLPVAARIALCSGQKRVHAGSLIVSLFGDLVGPRGGRIWLGSLIRLLEPLGLSERLIRTTVFRLVREQWLRSEALGRRSDYLLTSSGQRRCAEAAKRIYAAHAPDWDRRWRLVLAVGPLAAKERDALRRALFWRGFGALGAECFVHPGADLTAAFDALVADGLGHLLPALMPLLAADASLAGSASHADLVSRAWDLSELACSYADFIAAYTPVLLQLRVDQRAPVDDEQAFLTRLLLIHDYRRLLLRDPQLPEVLLPGAWSGEGARALCRELYRRLLAPSERHLDHFLSTADGNCPPRQLFVERRFAADDPLS